MELHPRENIVNTAKSEFYDFYIQWMRKHNLTHAELTQILADEIMTLCKYMIRFERHGRYDKPGGLKW